MAQSSADVISNGVVQWSTICDATITGNSGTQVNIHVTSYVHSVCASSSYINSWVWCAVGGYAGSTSSGGVSPGDTNAITSADYLINKTTSAQSIWCSAKNWMPGSSIGAYRDGAEAGLNVGVPALDSHTVSYNANGGSGAPGNQTKWYGSVLTLSTTAPTRDGYSFQGWATSPTGSVSYSPGSQYGADADITLYAVWQQLYIPPSFSAADAHRTTSLASTDTNPTGEYALATFSWAVDTSYTTGNTAKSVIFRYRTAPAIGDGQWLWKRYKYTSASPIIPTLDMIANLSAEAQGYQSDSATLLDLSDKENNFIEIWESYATVVTAFTWSVTIQSDDDFSLYIDEVKVADGSCGTKSISVNFPVGTHRVDFLLREGSGTEGLKLTSGTPLSKIVANITAPTDLGVAPPWTTVTPSGVTTGTSGTVTTNFLAALQTAYMVQCIITDSSGQPSASTTIVRMIAFAAIPIDVGSKGSAVGILCAAPDSGLRVGADAEVDGRTTTTTLRVSSSGHTIAGMWTGTTVVVTDGTGCAGVMSLASVRTLTGGLDFTQMTDVFLVSNGDMNAATFNATGSYYTNGGGLWVKTDKPSSMIRINWLLVCRR